MEDFRKKKEYMPVAQEDDDTYAKDLERRMKAQQSKGILSKEIASEIREVRDDTNVKTDYAIKRVKNTASIWGIIILSVTNTALMYPFSVKWAKRIFRVQKRWQIHFAIFPFLAIYNVSTFAVLESLYLYYKVNKDYPHIFND